jgi:hypothetical protein
MDILKQMGLNIARRHLLLYTDEIPTAKRQRLAVVDDTDPEFDKLFRLVTVSRELFTMRLERIEHNIAAIKFPKIQLLQDLQRIQFDPRPISCKVPVTSSTFKGACGACRVCSMIIQDEFVLPLNCTIGKMHPECAVIMLDVLPARTVFSCLYPMSRINEHGQPKRVINCKHHPIDARHLTSIDQKCIILE